MWPLVALALVVMLAVGAGLAARSRQRVLDRASELLVRSGDTSRTPATIDDALRRIEHRLQSPRRDLLPHVVGAALDQMSTGAVVADSAGKVVLRNRSALPYASGRHGDALVEAVVQARLADALRGQATDEELFLHGPPERVLLVVGTPLQLDDAQVGAIVLIDDVSDHHRLDAIRRDFVANVSHELRTPVGALSLLAETLEDEEDPETRRRLMRRVHIEAQRLSSLIDDLLDLSRIEAGIGEKVEVINLGVVLREAAATLRPVADHRSVSIDIETHEPDIAVRGNRSQLVSAITNLLENAIKFSEIGGPVFARIAVHGNEVAVAIQDTGIGIPQRDTQRVFERFYRVDRGRSSDTGGTGLGLSIVRHVAVNHFGRVELTSQEGVGSTFTMILPAATSIPG